MGEVERGAQIMTSPGPAAPRLRELIRPSIA